MSKDIRANIKIKRETRDELSRYARRLAVELDRRVTIDEAIVHAIKAVQKEHQN